MLFSSAITGASPVVFRNSLTPEYQKDFPKRLTCFAERSFDIRLYFSGFSVNLAQYNESCLRFARLYKFSRNLKPRIEEFGFWYIKSVMLSAFIFFELTKISFLVNNFLSDGTLFKVLHAVIISPIRINNDIFAVDLLKGDKIFESKVHFFYG